MKYLIFLYLVLCPLAYSHSVPDMREFQQLFFQLAIIIIYFSSFFVTKKRVEYTKTVKNPALWIGVFGLWTVLLYILGNMDIGGNYLQNIFLSFVLFSVCVQTLDRKDVIWLFRGVATVCLINVVYLFFQAIGWGDIIFRLKGIATKDLFGFFGFKEVMGIYFAISLPAILHGSKETIGFELCQKRQFYGRVFKVLEVLRVGAVNFLILIRSLILPICLFIPIYISVSSGAYLGGIGACLFFLWFRKRVVLWFLTIPLIVGSIYFVVKIEMPHETMNTNRFGMWKLVLEDSFRSPLLGNGLDGFRFGARRYFLKPNTNKSWRADKITLDNGQQVYDLTKFQERMDWWDNAHNEFIQGLYEFSLPGMVLVGLFIYSFMAEFRKNKSSPVYITLLSMLLVILLSGITQFPLHLARIGHIVPVILAFLYLEIRGSDDKPIERRYYPT